MRAPRRWAVLAAVLLALAHTSSTSRAHDIPNAQVDRSTQVTVTPGRLTIDYEVSLAELTLVRDLRSLVESLPKGGPAELFDAYGRVTGPLNARGFSITVDDRPVELTTVGFDLNVEEHPRFTFHFQADLPDRGRLVVRDDNFAGSEGMSRLAIRSRDGVTLRGDDLPADVNQIRPRPVWQLSDAEERRTKRAEVEYELGNPHAPPPETRGSGASGSASSRPIAPSGRLARLLDRAAGLSTLGMLLVAFAIGAAHAFQPGHGKTLVAATALGGGRRTLRAALLAAVFVMTHTGSVLLIAGVLWWARTTRYGDIHVALTRAAGFAIAAVGLWRLGRHLAGYGEHDAHEAQPTAVGSIVGLGVAGGLVPCWDAVGLVVLAGAAGRLALGVVLLLAFGLGMGAVLVAVGLVAAHVRSLAVPRSGEGAWERRLGIGSGLVLTGIGLYFLAQ